MAEMHRYARFVRALVTTAFVLIPLAIFAGIFVFQNGQLAKERALIEAERLSNVIAAQQMQQFTNIRNLLISIASYAEVENRDAEGCNRTLALLLEHVNTPTYTYHNLGIADSNGQVFCSALPAERSVNTADRYYFQRAMQTRSFSIGEYQIGRITGKESINFGYPVLDEKGAATFVIFAAESLDAIHERANRVRGEGYPILIITDRNGTILVHPEYREAVGTHFTEHERMHNAPSGSFSAIGPDGTAYLFGFATPTVATQGDHIHFIIGIPLVRISAYLDDQIARYAEYFFGAIALFGALGWFVSDRLVRRLLAHKTVS